MATKIQRWIDLLAALLRRNGAISFEELTADVPAYQGPEASSETRRRMFERDKDDLRAAGFAIVSDTENSYRLDTAATFAGHQDASMTDMARRATGDADRQE